MISLHSALQIACFISGNRFNHRMNGGLRKQQLHNLQAFGRNP